MPCQKLTQMSPISHNAQPHKGGLSAAGRRICYFIVRSYKSHAIEHSYFWRMCALLRCAESILVQLADIVRHEQADTIWHTLLQNASSQQCMTQEPQDLNKHRMMPSVSGLALLRQKLAVSTPEEHLATVL